MSFKEAIELEQFRNKADGLSFVDLLENPDFQLMISKLTDKSAHGVAKAIVASHVESVRQKLTDLANGEPLDIPHPTIEAVVDGTRVILVGVKHALITAAEIHPEYKKKVSQIVGEDASCVWFIEQGISGHFGLKGLSNVCEMEDLQMFVDSIKVERTGNRWKDALAIAKAGAKAVKIMPSVFGFADEEVKTMFRKIQKSAVRKPAYIFNALAFIETLKLPEPIDMEVRFVLGNIALDPDAGIDRSKFQAEWIRNNKKSSADVCGTIVGADHISQIKYFLENPLYSPRDAVKRLDELFREGEGLVE